ncbi:MAG: hypothetical protein HO274_12280 [Ferrovum myxofaciens]|uniref:hypothetical protein n=1 Tax=Ferrovum myxofaciens TaxID=416213 RepID=UPI002354FEB8|nr:hypothetical protein [Ferrovum myxofaciens]QKE41989.1 MAG: hypothetical protein HO274_12280 [Ferrovum myxofaciens]
MDLKLLNGTKLVNGIKLNKKGLLINNGGCPVHLRQGDMDGACGPYCIAMALLTLGRLERDHIKPVKKIDYRTHQGKFFKTIGTFDPMVISGTSGGKLLKLLEAHNLAEGTMISGTDNDKKLFPEITRALQENHPVAIDIKSSNDVVDHWTLAIGFNDTHLFLLDPGYELQTSKFWNATLSKIPTPTEKDFAYRYANPSDCSDVQINTMIEVQ